MLCSRKKYKYIVAAVPWILYLPHRCNSRETNNSHTRNMKAIDIASALAVPLLAKVVQGQEGTVPGQHSCFEVPNIKKKIMPI